MHYRENKTKLIQEKSTCVLVCERFLKVYDLVAQKKKIVCCAACDNSLQLETFKVETAFAPITNLEQIIDQAGFSSLQKQDCRWRYGKQIGFFF